MEDTLWTIMDTLWTILDIMEGTLWISWTLTVYSDTLWTILCKSRPARYHFFELVTLRHPVIQSI